MHPPPEVVDLISNLLRQSSGVLSLIQQVVIQAVSASHYFYFIQVMSINSGQANSSIVHLPSEDFIPKEVVSKESTVRVSLVDALSSSDIDQLS